MEKLGNSIVDAASDALPEDYEIDLLMNGIKLPEAAKAAVLPIPSMQWSGQALENGYNQAAQEVMAYNTMAESNREVVAVLNQLANRIIQAMRENRTEVNIGDDQIYASAKKGGAKYSKITGQPAF